jgi:NhaP-type Na+/H+ and K+/H+ antiporter
MSLTLLEVVMGRVCLTFIFIFAPTFVSIFHCLNPIKFTLGSQLILHWSDLLSKSRIGFVILAFVAY